MKRVVTMLLALVMACALCGCGKGNQASAEIVVQHEVIDGNNTGSGSTHDHVDEIAFEGAHLVIRGSTSFINVKIRNNFVADNDDQYVDSVYLEYQALDEQGDSLYSDTIFYTKIEPGQGAWQEDILQKPLEDISAIKLISFRLYTSRNTNPGTYHIVANGYFSEPIVLKISDLEVK